jgi:hypothetical protein
MAAPVSAAQRPGRFPGPVSTPSKSAGVQDLIGRDPVWQLPESNLLVTWKCLIHIPS